MTTNPTSVTEDAVAAFWAEYESHLPAPLRRGKDTPAAMAKVIRLSLAAAMPHLSPPTLPIEPETPTAYINTADLARLKQYGTLWRTHLTTTPQIDGTALYASPPRKAAPDVEGLRETAGAAGAITMGPTLDRVIDRLRPCIRLDADGEFLAPKDEALSDLITLAESMARTVSSLADRTVPADTEERGYAKGYADGFAATDVDAEAMREAPTALAKPSPPHEGERQSVLAEVQAQIHVWRTKPIYSASVDFVNGVKTGLDRAAAVVRELAQSAAPLAPPHDGLREAVQVKALEWLADNEEGHPEPDWEAKAATGSYRVRFDQRDLPFAWTLSHRWSTIQAFLTADEAKVAAQTDFATRIRSALNLHAMSGKGE